ncbi:MAG: BTAD domain-containing putative transcriptional regulator [Sphingomonadales bacterium]
MAGFSLKLFGGFRLFRDEGQEVQVSSKRGQALLSYLALNQGQHHTRDKLVGLLWPDRSDDQARHSLRQELSTLRKAFKDASPFIVTGGNRLAINPQVLTVDVWAFEHLAGENKPKALTHAATLYTGDLLEGLALAAPVFEQWCAGEQLRLKDLACSVFERLAQTQAATGQEKEALEVAQKLALLDPLREGTHRLLMQLFAGTGRRSDALRQYQACVNILKDELDVAPDPETQRLYAAIHSGQGISPGPAEKPKNLALPNKPSIAVLPFDNLSGDIDQEYFADGIAEDIITTLGRFRWFFVIARNSSFTYKGKAIDVKQVGQELGVRYVLEGSVRRAGQRVRITAELTDTTTGQHIWAEKYDRNLGDIFAMQDEITQAVIASVAAPFQLAEADRAERKDPANFDAWDCCIRGRWHLWKFNKVDNIKAQGFLKQSINLDPTFASAHADLAGLYVIDGLFGWNRPSIESGELARAAGDKALHFDDQDVWAHVIVGLVDAFSKRHQEGLHRLEQAIEINPNLATAHGFLGWVEAFIGNTERAVIEAEKAIHLSPRDPFIMFWHAALSGAAFVDGNYKEAARWARQAIEDRKDFPSGHRLLAASLGQMGEDKKARAAVKEVLRLIPDQTLGNLKVQLPYKDPEVIKHFLEGLRRGGLPE